jgi:hypothetical protein
MNRIAADSSCSPQVFAASNTCIPQWPWCSCTADVRRGIRNFRDWDLSVQQLWSDATVNDSTNISWESVYKLSRSWVNVLISLHPFIWSRVSGVMWFRSGSDEGTAMHQILCDDATFVSRIIRQSNSPSNGNCDVFGNCIKMCEDFYLNFNDERTGCYIMTAHRLTLPFSPRGTRITGWTARSLWSVQV